MQHAQNTRTQTDHIEEKIDERVMSGTDTEREEMEAARVAVMECEKEIQDIKRTLRSAPTATNEDDQNKLRVSVLKVTTTTTTTTTPIDESSFLETRMQVSSPVEEGLLTRSYDPLDANAEGSFVEIPEVDLSVATLTVSVAGLSSSSEPRDLSTVCDFDPRSSDAALVRQIDLDLFPTGATDVTNVTNDTSTTTTVQEDNKDDDKNTDEIDQAKDKDKEDEDEQEADEKQEDTNQEPEDQQVTTQQDKDDAPPEDPPTNAEEKSDEKIATEQDNNDKEADNNKVDTPPDTPISEPTSDTTVDNTTTTATEDERKISPVGKVSLRVEFTPSAKERKEALFGVLNDASRRKSAAVDRLRRSAAKLSSPTTNAALSSATTTKTPAVAPGFLRTKKKGAAAKEPGALARTWSRTLGPDSLLRKVIFPVSKNYLLFFGAVFVFHFKGHELALPAPV